MFRLALSACQAGTSPETTTPGMQLVRQPVTGVDSRSPEAFRASRLPPRPARVGASVLPDSSWHGGCGRSRPSPVAYLRFTPMIRSQPTHRPQRFRAMRLALAVLVLPLTLAPATASGASPERSAAPSLVLNEFMAGPARDWDGTGTFSSRDDEWVEVRNPDPGTLDLTGYLLSDG